MITIPRRDFLRGAVTAAATLPFAKAATNRSCILLVLTGGPSHLDTWDMKPEAPSDIRSPFRAIRTNVPGIEISEIFPLMAKHADKYALIRSVYSDTAPVHEAALAPIDAATEDHVTLPGPLGFMGCHAKPDAARTRQTFAENCRTARELVEQGVPFIRVNMFDTVFSKTTWDCHGARPFSTIRDYKDTVGPAFDFAFTTLLEDLSQRGLLATTRIVAMGEFGRTPRINPAGGRDHWTKCQTVIVAGAGIEGGRIYGSSDATGAEPKDNPVRLASVLATMNIQDAAFAI